MKEHQPGPPSIDPPGSIDIPIEIAEPPRPTPPSMATATTGTPVRNTSRNVRTQFAMRALSLAELFQQVCGSHRLGGAGGAFRLEMSAPEGPSTGGGKQAVQHIKLVPESGTTIVMGQANAVEGSAELRSHSYLTRLHAQRFKGQRLPFPREPYDALLKQVESFLVMQKLSVMIDDGPIEVGGAETFGAGTSARTSMAGVAAAVVALGFLAVFLFQILR